MSNNKQIDEINEIYDEKPDVDSVARIVLNILTAIENDTIMNDDDKNLEDTPVEQTLCAIWDLSSLEEYANILMDECQIHRIMLKVIKCFFTFFSISISALN